MTTMLNALAAYPSLNRAKHSSLVNDVELARPPFRRDAVPRTAPPTGNERPECAVEGRIQASLEASPYPAVRRVRCKFEEGLVKLHGTVPSYHCVQLAIALVRAHMPENIPVQNRLLVFSTSEA